MRSVSPQRTNEQPPRGSAPGHAPSGPALRGSALRGSAPDFSNMSDIVSITQ